MSTPRIRCTFIALLVALGLSAACREEQPRTKHEANAPAAMPTIEDAKLKILFIGNSLTSTNDLPGLLEALIDAVDAGPVHVMALAFANSGLGDHWQRDQAGPEIASGNWDFVIMQQGPSATEGRPSLLEYSKRYADLVPDDATTRIALYQVWPSSQRDFDFQGVCDSYRMAAEQAGGLLLPVGEAWRLAKIRDPELKLYGNDGFHPSRAGTYLAAMVMYQQVTGNSPLGLPASITTRRHQTYNLTTEQAMMLQEVAIEANAKHALP